MRRWLNVYFGFTRREFNGLTTLMILITLVMFFPKAYDLIKEEEPITEAEQLAALKLAIAEQRHVAKTTWHKNPAGEGSKKTSGLFRFDPNRIGQADWERLGLSARQAKAILRYRERGGTFRKPADLQKMYTITPRMYDKLVPYVRIDGDQRAAGPVKITRAWKKQDVKSGAVTIEVNGADTTELDRIRGIGPTFANRIMKYRERIGGFYKKEQLMEVFGLDTVKFNEIQGQVTVDISRIKKINVNTVMPEDFKNHPYIRYKQVNALIQYRKQHGNYRNIADLYHVAILNQETIERLAPYLEF